MQACGSHGTGKKSKRARPEGVALRFFDALQAMSRVVQALSTSHDIAVNFTQPDLSIYSRLD